MNSLSREKTNTSTKYHVYTKAKKQSIIIISRGEKNSFKRFFLYIFENITKTLSKVYLTTLLLAYIPIYNNCMQF